MNFADFWRNSFLFMQLFIKNHAVQISATKNLIFRQLAVIYTNRKTKSFISKNQHKKIHISSTSYKKELSHLFRKFYNYPLSLCV